MMIKNVNYLHLELDNEMFSHVSVLKSIKSNF